MARGDSLIDQASATMEEWVRWKMSTTDQRIKDCLIGYSEGDWIALRCLHEEFPREGETPEEKAHRSEVIGKYLDRLPGTNRNNTDYATASTFGRQLEALREDREKNPQRWPGESWRVLRPRPWRQAMLASRRVSLRKDT